MKPLASHLILVSAETCNQACSHVEDFFSSTLLVRYDKIEILKEHCSSGEHSGFGSMLDKGLTLNSEVLQRFIHDLKKTGFQSVDDLHDLEHGYPSKILHIITHFVDGFIGIDTKFYNLIDDSHWVPEDTQEAIKNSPDHYWLILVNGYSATPEKASLIQQ